MASKHVEPHWNNEDLLRTSDLWQENNPKNNAKSKVLTTEWEQKIIDAILHRERVTTGDVEDATWDDPSIVIKKFESFLHDTENSESVSSSQSSSESHAKGKIVMIDTTAKKRAA